METTLLIATPVGLSAANEPLCRYGTLSGKSLQLYYSHSRTKEPADRLNFLLFHCAVVSSCVCVIVS